MLHFLSQELLRPYVIISRKSAYEQVAWVRVCNYVKLNQLKLTTSTKNSNTYALLYTHKRLLLSMWLGVLFLVQLTNFALTMGSIGVTRSDSSCLFLCVLGLKPLPPAAFADYSNGGWRKAREWGYNMKYVILLLLQYSSGRSYDEQHLINPKKLQL